MDPQAAFDSWCNAVKSQRIDEAKDYAEALVLWLKKGGFEPTWRGWEKLWFKRWCRRNNLLDAPTGVLTMSPSRQIKSGWWLAAQRALEWERPPCSTCGSMTKVKIRADRKCSPKNGRPRIRLICAWSCRNGCFHGSFDTCVRVPKDLVWAEEHFAEAAGMLRQALGVAK